MTPLYFGPPERQLFAIYHAPRRETEVNSALLMCCPFGHEATRVHRLYRVLAERMAQKGIAVLRFDYFGTGESAGNDADGEMTGWQRDLLAAHDELVRRSHSRCVTWLAARLGATLALQSAPQAEGLLRLILWDPILDGPAYVDELRAAQLETLELTYYAKNPAWYAPRAQGEGPCLTEVLGHQVGPQLALQLTRFQPDSLTLPAGVEATVFSLPGATTTPQWCARENALGRSVSHESLEHTIVWTSDPIPNQAIVPADVTRRLGALIR